MRLFLAIDLPHDVKQRLAKRARPARGGWPKARWVRAETLHVTLFFLGEVDERAVDPIDRALRPLCARHAPMTARVGGAGVFPPRGRASVLWTGFETGGALGELHREMETALASIELDGEALYEPEKRRFSAHVTLARCRPPWKRLDAERWIESFAEPVEKAPVEEVPVEDVTLFASRLTPSGAIYRVISKYPLAGAP